MTRRLAYTTALVWATTASALADRLILNDGAVLHGAVARTHAGYALTTPDGRHATFDSAEVKRAAYESRVTPVEAAAMLNELRALVEPVLTAPEPDQFVQYRDIATYDESSSAYGGSARFDAWRGATFRWNNYRFDGARSASADAFDVQRDFSAIAVDTVERDKTADNVFADEWLRYAAMFDALAQDARYRALTDARRHAHALGDFSVRAPQDYAVSAQALRDALRALDNCLNLAEDTRRRVSALPLRALSHNEAIRDLENKLAYEEDRLRTARDYWRQKRRVQDVENRLRERIARRDTEIARARRVAERKINEFAHAREVSLQLLSAAQAHLDSLANTNP